MIFEDFSQKRWKKAKLVFAGIFLILLVLLGGTIVSLIVNPPLASVQERQDNIKKAAHIKANILANDKKTVRPINSSATSQTNKNRRPRHQKNTTATTTAKTLATTTTDHLLSAAFLEQNDDASVRDFVKHATATDIVIPDWYYLTDGQCSVTQKENPKITATISSSSRALIVPRYTNGLDNKWHGQETQAMLADSKTNTCVAQKLSDLIIKSGVAGINVDLENLRPEDKDNYLDFLDTLATNLHQQQKILTVDVSVGDPAYDLEYIGQIADYVIVMNYDEHYLTSAPGPIASANWFSDNIDTATAAIPKNKVIVALGAYGYDWTVGSDAPANSLGFDDAMRLAADSGAQPEMKSDSGYNMYFSYTDGTNHGHQVWFLNGLTAWNEYLKAKSSQTAGVALWRLGTEDQSYWQIFNPETTGQSFATTPHLESVNIEDESELFDLRYDRTAGALQLTTDTDGSIDYAIYNQIPNGYDLAAIGQAIPDKQLILTFDDGPDETWTPQILQILKDNNVSGTFFLVGDQAQRFPDIVKQETKAGMTIGNHTYLHPNVTQISSRRLTMELNETQRLIESETGHRTILFRPPYDTDSTPSTPEELRAIATSKKLGYVIAGANIDAEDWERPGVDKIINNVLTGLKDPGNHVIVMHDAGGDRSQTVAALKILIPELKKQGYTFTTFAKATGLHQDQINPPLSGRELFFVDITSIWNFILRWGWIIITWLFIFTTVIAIFRILFLGTMVIRSIKRYKKRNNQKFEESVTVIVPCYNEEKTVAYTLSALQESTKKNLEILVVNDGSSDNTSGVVRDFMKSDPRIHLLEKENGGKFSALNLAFAEAANEIIVTIDGDTILLPNTVDELTKPFADPKVDAVCGNVEVGNVRNILTGFQALEYITTQNFDRRAFDEMNCISVVPGATGAWRRQKVLAVGGYGSDTLTEDADLTLRMLSAGAVIVYAPEARSRTEAPETIKGLAKQRFRWSYGTYQCLWKNRKLMGHGSLGWVALPNMLFFQIIFPILSPIGDLVFILSIFRGDFGAIASGYIMFTIMDLAGSLLAFSLEKKPKKMMWLILIQRFFYRQFMYIITYKSIIAIIKGRHYGWNKLNRTGNAGTKNESVKKN